MERITRVCYGRSELSRYLFDYLTYTYPDVVWVVIIYDVSGHKTHAIYGQGEFYTLFQQYGNNVVVGSTNSITL